MMFWVIIIVIGLLISAWAAKANELELKKLENEQLKRRLAKAPEPVVPVSYEHQFHKNAQARRRNLP